MRRCATGQSCASRPVNRMAMRRPLGSASAWIFVLRPPRERPTACFCSIDHLGVSRWSIPGKLRKKVFPDAAPRPSARSDYRSSSVDHTSGQSHHRQPLFRTCAIPLITRRSSARWTPRTSVGNCGNPRPLLIAQPEQIPAHPRLYFRGVRINEFSP
jgi:hypothetical protein